jgi:hypothetical protein
MSNAPKGVVAGLVATLVLSALMILNSKFGLLPQINIIGLLAVLGTLSVPSAWMDHFIVGVVVWGLLYAGFDAVVTRPPVWIKGMIFGVFAWLMMMVAFMPLAGAGFFGANLGIAPAVELLILHLIYGVVLAVTYDLLGVLVPVRVAVTPSHETVIAVGGPNPNTKDSADINDHLPTSSPSGKTVLICPN